MKKGNDGPQSTAEAIEDWISKLDSGTVPRGEKPTNNKQTGKKRDLKNMKWWDARDGGKYEESQKDR